jgi:glycosyltransferase involved in cell wall biosynthesis
VRVLYLNPFSQEVSGPDESLRTLLGALVPRGLEAHLVLPSPGPQVPRYEALGVTVHFAPLARLRRDLSAEAALYPVSLGRAALAIGALARRLDVDLIHTNMEVLLEGGLAARALGLPHVLHYRGNTLDRPKLVFDALTALWTRTADQVFCISGATAEVFRRRGYVRGVEVLYNPVDLVRFAPAPASEAVRTALGATAGAPLVGTVGRLHPRKDLETFVRAAARVAAEVPEARFVVVGAAESPDEAAYRDRLAALARELGLEGRLRLAGARRDVPEVMRALDVFVLTSRHEGFGRVVAEAMGAARPVVVTDEGAPPELVEHGKLGLCAAAGDPAAFAAAITGLVRDRGRAAALGAAATAAARQFDVAGVGDRVWDRYRQLVEAHGRDVKRTAAPTARAR